MRQLPENLQNSLTLRGDAMTAFAQTVEDRVGSWLELHLGADAFIVHLISGTLIESSH